MTNRPTGPPHGGGTPFGQYRLITLLGRGGMGEVWRAHDTVTDRIVALKLLPARFAEDSVFKERFRREAHAAAQLNEPHVVPIHTYGEINGHLFVDMRLIEGRDVETVLAEGPLDPARAVLIIEQVAKAVHAAHKVGLVHRDIKPSNILLDDDDFAYLIDFGIARAAGETGLTATGGVVGTLRYMAPERFSTGDADARSDIYALACVLYECLTGSRPFPGDSMEQQVAGHLATPPPRPSVTGAPAKFDDVIATGMAKDPKARYPTTVQLARAARDAITSPMANPLPTVRTQSPTRPAPQRPPPPLRPPPTRQQPPRNTGFASPAPPPGRPFMAPPPVPAASPSSSQPAATTRRSKRWVVPTAIAAVAAVLGGLGIWYTTRSSTAPPASSTASSASTAPPVTSTAPPVTSIASSASTAPPAPAMAAVDFREWRPFGGIDAKVGVDGRSVVLDTHNTTENWTAAWSGLIAPGPPQCSTHITGSARDISHNSGVAGGFGIGLTTLQKDASGQEASYGSAVQYDFGLNGYFAVAYPTAESYSLVPAPLDHEWHTFDISIDTNGFITARIDGQTVVRAKGDAVCGTPTIRVWAGSAEFREFSVQPTN
ncbi:serine/threonine-protein kinase [Mycobacterium sp. NPDC051804]|uniref:serine/threonine-protein kinase n=1 Tax=Mycobacterium sp. NPDC051804 TaxID=3364295 RepID=UPI003788ACAC